MNTEIQIFDSLQFGQLRGMNINGEAWLMATDVARRLGYTNPQKAIRDHVDDDDKTLNDSFTINGTNPVLINESGLYTLVLSSKLPKAREFKHWVTSEVLPQIRKTGGYILVKPEDDAGGQVALDDGAGAATSSARPRHHLPLAFGPPGCSTPITSKRVTRHIAPSGGWSY